MRWTWLLIACACAETGPAPLSDSGPGPSPNTGATADTDTTTTVVGELGDCDNALSLTATQPTNIRTGRTLELTLEQPESAWVVCRDDADSDEAHLVENATASTTQLLAVHGLKAPATYTCEVRTPSCVAGDHPTLSFDIERPTTLPLFEVTRDASVEMSGVYTLFNTQQNAFFDHPIVAIVDPDGDVRWHVRGEPAMVGDIDASLIGSDRVHFGGGWGIGAEDRPNRGMFRTVDLFGNIVVDRELPDAGLGFNHHSEPLDDGSYLSLTFSENSRAGQEWHGIGIEHWHPDDGLLSFWDSQTLVDAGVVAPPPIWEDSPYHANSVTRLTDAIGDAYWVSLYAEQQIWRIDIATGMRSHIFGAGADGSFSLRDMSGAPLPASEWPYVQHDPDYTDDGRVLVYDNGFTRPIPDGQDPYSRVAEYQLDFDNATATLLWSWTEPNWYNPIVGDADYLANGNVLITKGFSEEWSAGAFNATDVSALVEIEPATGKVAWRMAWPDGDHLTFRSERYDGCAVFANAKYCDTVAARIEELEGLR